VFAHCADCSRTYQGPPLSEAPHSTMLTEKTPQRIKCESQVMGQ